MTGEAKKERMRIDLAGLAVLAALTAGAYFGGLEPLLSRQAEAELQKATLKQQREETARLASSLTIMRGQLVKVRQAVAASSIRLHSGSHLNQHLADVSQVAVGCRLRVDEIKPGGVITSPRYEQVPIQFSGSGTYASCTEFLQKLHVTFPDTGVTSLEIRGRPDDPQHRATFRFGLVWYASPSPSGGGASASLTAAETQNP